MPEALLLFAAAVLAVPASAQVASTGPVTVTADRAEWTSAGVMSYAGNVRLTTPELELMGEQLDLRTLADGHFEARVSGTPARLRHQGAAKAPPLEAEARQLFYDSSKATVQLTGAIRLARGADRLSGESVLYDIAAQRVQAAGGDGGQVRIVIQPPEQKGKGRNSSR